MRPWMILTAGLAFASVPLAARAQSQTVPFPVALSGTPAPAGGNYTTSFSNPVLNASGQVAFQATTSVAGNGIFVGTPGSPLTPVAVAGSPAPSGGNYTEFDNGALLSPALNASGQVAFSAITTSSPFGAVFAGTPGVLATAALAGTPAPAPASGNYTGNFSNPVLNDAGKVAFYSGTSGSGAGIFVGTPGSPLTVAALQQGAAAPDGGNYTDFYAPVLNATGRVAFFAPTTVSPNGALFAGIPGSTLTAAALTGTPAPAGGNYTSLVGTPAFNASGQVAFYAGTSGGGGIFAGTPGSVTAVAVTGNAAPAGGNYNGDFLSPALNASGKVAFFAGTGSSGGGIFVGTPGALATAALLDAPAPNCGGATYSYFPLSPMLNASGQVAFLASLSGTGVVAGTNDQALFAGAPGSVILVVRTGDVINVNHSGGVDDRTVASINIYSSLNGGQSMSLNDSGLLVYELGFTDGSEGIFTSQIATVPEPTGLLLAAGLLFVSRTRLPRRHGH